MLFYRSHPTHLLEAGLSLAQGLLRSLVWLRRVPELLMSPSSPCWDCKQAPPRLVPYVGVADGIGPCVYVVSSVLTELPPKKYTFLNPNNSLRLSLTGSESFFPALHSGPSPSAFNLFARMLPLSICVINGLELHLPEQLFILLHFILVLCLVTFGFPVRSQPSTHSIEEVG